MSGAVEGVALREAQDARRLALIERLGTIADRACATPLPGDLGDVAYDLLRQAAAQISSDRLHIALITPPARSYADGVEDAAKVCEDQQQVFLSPQYATGQPLSSFHERFACGQCAAAIRLLSQGGKA